MELFGKTLDTETQLLIAIGSAVAAGCQPCLTRIVGMARNESVEENKLKTAAIIGQFVKDQPATDMKRLADELLGTHLLDASSAGNCPMENASPPESSTTSRISASSPSECGCGCG